MKKRKPKITTEYLELSMELNEVKEIASYALACHEAITRHQYQLIQELSDRIKLLEENNDT